MRAAYFITWGADGPQLSPGTSVRRKIGYQIRHWRKLGVEVRLFINARGECRQSWREEFEDDELYIAVADSRLSRFRAANRIADAISAYRPDLLYMRQERYSLLVEGLMRRYPSFVELNGDEVAETAQGGVLGRAYWLYVAATRSLVFRRAAGLVAVSRELADVPAWKRFHLPTTVVANSIDLTRFPTLPLPQTRRHPRVGMMGSSFGAKWHGAEKLYGLARARPDWAIDVIGLTEAQIGGARPPNVTAYGALDRPDYEPIVQQWDAAFGTLSAYEKNAHETSSLKVREYLAYGMPTISGVVDTDFPSGADFFLTLPNRPDNISANLEAISSFVERWRGRRVSRQDVAVIDVETKEAQRVAFFRSVLGDRSLR